MTRADNYGRGLGRLLGDEHLTRERSRANHVMSEAAERWLAAYTGSSTDLIDADRPDPGFDLVLPRDGRRLAGAMVDVKWSRWIPGMHVGRDGVGYPTLNLSTWKGAHRAELYALIIGQSSADFALYAWASGWAYLAELMAAPHVAGQYGRPYHALGFDYLHPLHGLR